MRPIIGVNGDCLWLCGDVCHSPHPYLPPGAMDVGSSGVCSQGPEYPVGSNFRFVRELELKPALGWRASLTGQAALQFLTSGMCNGRGPKRGGEAS